VETIKSRSGGKPRGRSELHPSSTHQLQPCEPTTRGEALESLASMVSPFEDMRYLDTPEARHAYDVALQAARDHPGKLPPVPGSPGI
jgi:hypothetical protein